MRRTPSSRTRTVAVAVVAGGTLLWCAPQAALAQQLTIPSSAWSGDAGLKAAIPDLAARAQAIYADSDRGVYLDNLFRLQIAAGRYAAAESTLAALARTARGPGSLSPLANLPYAVYAAARARVGEDDGALYGAFADAFRDMVGRLDDTSAAQQVTWAFGTRPGHLEDLLRSTLDARRGSSSLPLEAVVDLVRKYVAAEVSRTVYAWIPRLQEADDHRRYHIEWNRLVRTPDGAAICVLVVRPRADTAALPSLLNFTVYADSANLLAEARRSAAHGYVGVEGLSRGKGCSPDAPVPIEHDGADADAVIEWIARQSWSDGRVGMFGGSYEGFTQWAAAKHPPAALRALMPSVTFAPGVDFPMDGNIFLNYAYPWPLFTTDVKGLDYGTYGDSSRWDQLNRDWYLSGAAYRALDSISGVANPVFNRWLAHPDYDAYWRNLIPYRDEFARIAIPVLTTTGYYDSGQIGALYYFLQHYAWNPTARHYLVIGPYDHIRGQRGTLSPLGSPMRELRGYTLDPVAQIDIMALRYQWFDFVLKGGPRPPILQDRVNYEVMGANQWRHVRSLDAMSDRRLRFYLLGDRRVGAQYRLSRRAPARAGAVRQTVDLADRSDAARTLSGGDLIDQALDTWNIVADAPHLAHALVFVSDTVPTGFEVSGLFSGHLEFVANKRDFDFGVTLFELTPGGRYMQLSYYWSRASYAGDRGRRRLLIPGRRERRDFTSGRLTSRRFEPGSRLVVVIHVLKQAGEEINYGTGRVVSEESVADAGAALQVRWSNASFVDVPVAARWPTP